MKTAKQVIAEYNLLRSKIQDDYIEALKLEAKKIFDFSDEIKGITWTQGHYFNDGDATHLSVSDIDLDCDDKYMLDLLQLGTMQDIEDEYEPYPLCNLLFESDKNPKAAELGSLVTEFNNGMSLDLLELTFGNHKKISIDRSLIVNRKDWYRT